jgi:hypothetical protein
MPKAILIKPLDGDPAGTEREFSKTDYDRLRSRGAIRAAGPVERKMEPDVRNKMAPAVANKSLILPETK